MEEVAADAPESPDDGTLTLMWLASPEARATARTRLARRGLPTSDALVDDVIGDALLGVVKQRSRGATSIDNPAAYGSTVIKNVIHRLLRRETDSLDDVPEPMVHDDDVVDPATADNIRVLIASKVSPPWLTSATLTYLTILMYPMAVPEHAPAPISGARPDQASVWPALWLAGLRELFPDPCPEKVRRRRARHIAHVLDHAETAFAEYRLEMERSDG